ncbi:hypothetical protein ARMGADRAFT_1017583 [Armillaria gallica]|uniref:Uncharacterized protein n=1 Tax=Armillaria gallica TaxID=47427 RepID=A0A2H3CSX4_ARMGA|nr:hypothetical protein ARMGADRAFT_1017583 [Armillaria gallica]
MLTSQMLLLHASVMLFLPLPGNAYGAFAKYERRQAGVCELHQCSQAPWITWRKFPQG